MTPLWIKAAQHISKMTGDGLFGVGETFFCASRFFRGFCRSTI